MQLARSIPSFVLASTLLFGCSGGKKPPTLASSKPEPIAISVPATPEPKDLWGYAKLRDPVSLAGRLLGPMAQPMMLSLGISPTDLKPGSVASMYLWDPEDKPVLAAPSALILPLPTEGERAQELSRVFPESARQAVAGGTLFLLNPASQAKLGTQRDALLKLAATPSPYDLVVYAYLDPILQKHGTTLRTLLAKASAQGQQAAMPGTEESVSKLFGQLVDALTELKSAAVAANLTDKALELSLITEAKVAGAKVEPYAVPDLLQFLPPAHLRFQWNTRDMQKFMDFYMRIYAPMFESQPPLKDAMQAVLRDWQKAGQKMSMATSVSVGGDTFLQLSAILKVDDGKAAMAAMRSGFQVLQSPAAKQSWEKLGIAMSSSTTQGIRKLHGWPVDRYEYSYKVQKPELAQAQAMFDKLSSVKMEVVQVGPYLVFAMGGSVDQAVSALMTGKGEFSTEAHKRFPAGAAIYFDLDLARIAQTVEKASGRPLAIPLPAGAEIISGASFDGGPSGLQKLYVPKALVDLGIGLLVSAAQSRSRPNDDFGYDSTAPMGPPPGAPPP
ncbi:MAG: hypothetical protein JNM83_27075 [Myxococcales bacterium]|nr:hypothetical protein [Myxococcales bacterium]